jgi:hypothetical protein
MEGIKLHAKRNTNTLTAFISAEEVRSGKKNCLTVGTTTYIRMTMEIRMTMMMTTTTTYLKCFKCLKTGLRGICFL